MDTNNTTRDNPNISGGTTELGMRVKDMGAQVVVFSILPVNGKGSSKNELIQVTPACMARIKGRTCASVTSRHALKSEGY